MKSYNKTFFIILVFVMLAVVSLNVSLDIYRVFGVQQWNKVFIEQNTRFLKAQHLNSHRIYNAFVFGSSRSNFYNVRLASQLTGLHYYSFSCQAERLDRILQKLLWLKRKGIPVREVIIGLDFDFMFLAEDLPGSALATMEHPEVGGVSLGDFYFPLLFQFDFQNWKNFIKVKLGVKSKDNIRLDLETGNWFYPAKDEQIARDREKYVKERFSGALPYERGVDRIPVNLGRLKALVDFLDREHIQRIIVINPYYSKTFMSFAKDEYQGWRDQVVAICGEVWDFSGLNQITQDPFLFYDPSHFRLPVGDEVLKRILGGRGGNSVSYRNDFGILLTNKQRTVAVEF